MVGSVARCPALCREACSGRCLQTQLLPIRGLSSLVQPALPLTPQLDWSPLHPHEQASTAVEPPMVAALQTQAAREGRVDYG